jgi:hypothetical protein
MEPVTTAIIAALVGGAAAADGNQAIIDAYDQLKALIVERFDSKSELVEAINALEQKPQSEGRWTTLMEAVHDAELANNAEIMAAADRLLKALEDHGDERVQTILDTATEREVFLEEDEPVSPELPDSPTKPPSHPGSSTGVED